MTSGLGNVWCSEPSFITCSSDLLFGSSLFTCVDLFVTVFDGSVDGERRSPRRKYFFFAV